MAVYGEVRQKGIDLGLSDLARMLLPMKQDVPADPTDIGFRGAGAVMLRLQYLSNLIEEFRLRLASIASRCN